MVGRDELLRTPIFARPRRAAQVLQVQGHRNLRVSCLASPSLVAPRRDTDPRRRPPPGRRDHLHVRPLHAACETAILANGRVLVQERRDTDHGAARRRLANNSTLAAIGSSSAGASVAAALLTNAVAPSTAEKYGRRWAEFEAFCTANNWQALPTSAAAVACFFGTLCERRLAPSSLQTYLTPINNRHHDGGFDKPATGPLIAKLRTGCNRMVADEAAEFPPTRAALPATVVWRIAQLALDERNAAWATRFTAVVLKYVLVRRTAEILSLQLRDVTLTATGGADIQIRRYKRGERRARMEQLVVSFPPAPVGTPRDLPIELLTRLLTRMQQRRAPPRSLLFSLADLDRPPNATDLTVLLLMALSRLAISPPDGLFYSSYSARSGGATALDICGVSRPTIARLLGHSRNDPKVADAHYVDALAPASLET